jgi:hypothetical protein
LAGHLWTDLIRVGIDEEEVGKQLETGGVEKFAASYLKSSTSSRPDGPRPEDAVTGRQLRQGG